MMNQEITRILSSAEKTGWVLEPEAKRLLKIAGLPVPNFLWAKTLEQASAFAERIGYPVTAKIVSPKAIHKSDINGVVVGTKDYASLKETHKRFQNLEEFSGILIEEIVSGLEMIIGAKTDYQFGPVILLGIGGTGVEIYQDTVLRMAPLMEKDVVSMIRGLKAHQLIEGYRGHPPVDIKALTRLLLDFSGLVMEISDNIESIDLNPVMCSSDNCIVADARIILRKKESKN
ncbi:MAG: acetate--CoA ligase family protein [Deltaproteobacteria bacterium]|nr:acetate--CoA ligase family protein [Deltaproteobacteria bacterium]